MLGDRSSQSNLPNTIDSCKKFYLFLFIKFFLFISILQENEYQADNLVSCYPANSMISVNGRQILDSPCANDQAIKIRNFNMTVNTSRINQVKQEAI